METISRRIFENSLLEFTQALSNRRSRGLFLGADVTYKKYEEVCDVSALELVHPNLVTILGRTKSGLVITEFVPQSHTTLRRLSPQTALQIMLGLCAGVEYLLQTGIQGTARPVSLNEVVFTDDFQVKIKETLFLSSGNQRIDDADALGNFFVNVLSTVSGEKDGLLQSLREFSARVRGSDELCTFSNIYRSVRVLNKARMSDETEALTPFLLGR